MDSNNRSILVRLRESLSSQHAPLAVLVRELGDSLHAIAEDSNPQVSDVRPAGHGSYRANRKLEQAEIDELVRLYKAGATAVELAAKFSLHRQTVAQHLNNEGVPIRPILRLTPVLVAELARQYNAGASTGDLGRRYGVAASSVGRALKKAGVTLRPPKHDRWHHDVPQS